MGIVERIQLLCKENNTTIKALERDLGLSSASVRHWNNSHPSCEKVLRVSDFFGVTLDWIVTGNDPGIEKYLSPHELSLVYSYSNLDDVFRKKIDYFIELASIKESAITYRDSSINYDKTDDLVREIPVIGYVAAGSPILALENNLSFIAPINPLVSYALFVKGNSMDPIILNGEIIQVIPQCQLENGEIGIIKIGEEVTCKKFYMLQDRIELRSFNGDFPPLKYSLDSSTEFQIIGKVVLNEAQLHRFRL